MKKLTLLLFAMLPLVTIAQDDIFADLDELQQEAPDFVTATFKATRVVNNPNIEMTRAGEMNFLVQHRFGRINQGFYELFGLDQASTRISFDFGVTDFLMVGIGRSGRFKTFDFNAKLRFLRQRESGSPVSVSYYHATAFDFTRQPPGRDLTATNKLSYVHQLLIARKFSKAFSFQLSPMIIHRNVVELAAQNNTDYALGMALRQKVSKRVSINLEYNLLADKGDAVTRYNSAALGVDIETGGHVFSLHFSNAQGMFERAYLAEATGDLGNGDIYFGFNINRVFTICKKKEVKEGL